MLFCLQRNLIKIIGTKLYQTSPPFTVQLKQIQIDFKNKMTIARQDRLTQVTLSTLVYDQVILGE